MGDVSALKDTRIFVFSAPLNRFCNRTPPLLKMTSEEEIMKKLKRLDRWEKLDEVSDRIKELRERFIKKTPEISVDRAQIYTKSYSSSFGMPCIIRRALALRDVLEGTRIYIEEGELIVGGLAEQPRAVPLFPEYDVDFLLDELDSFEKRIADRFVLSETNKNILREILPLWHGQTIKDNALRSFPDDARDSALDLINVLTAFKSGIGHMIVDYPFGIGNGLENTIKEIKETKTNLDIDDSNFASKSDFCDAAVICLEATIAFALRFSNLARSMANITKNTTRKKELLSIAHICEKVPAKPAESFWEACQSLWFIQLVLQIESNGHSVSLGRFDQYMYPYYLKCLDDNNQGKDFAKELIHCLWIKLSEINKVRDKISSVAFGGYPMFQHLTLGGQDRNGVYVANELSEICLDATAQVGLPQPSTSIRWYYGCPEKFLNHAVEIAAYGSGMPAFFNDEVLIPNMLQAGYSIEDARDYAIVGCTEPTVPGISEPWLTGGFISLPKILELTIFDGYDPVKEKQNHLCTGDVASFKSFDEFQDAFFKQLRFYLRQSVICNNVLDELHGLLAPTPFEAVFIQDCIPNCRTSLNGGARYNSTTINAVGIANAADSLAVIKKLIYEERRFRWEEIRDALKSNFEKAEQTRQILLKNAPKYGNDEPYVDDLGNDILNFLYQEIDQYRNARGGRYFIALYSIACHVLLADRVGALPDGRKKGMVLSDGGVSCAQGRDKNGLTALLNSVVKLDPYKAIGSTLLNVKLHPRVVDNPLHISKVAALIKTFFLNKGQHIQFNIIDETTLRDAQRHPEEYPYLMVRVAGFSVLFNSIDPLLQEDIIQRTAHDG